MSQDLDLSICKRTGLRRVVLTGGPGAGKTVISARLASLSPAAICLVPESATHVYQALQTRWDRLDLAGRRAVQREIYRHQIQQEQHAIQRHPDKLLLLDRGTIDGAAYWPEGPDAYWKDLGTTLEQELSRYDAIIWLQSCAVLGHYDGDRSNACRFEDASAAVNSGQALLKLWQPHGRLTQIDAFEKIEDKLTAVATVLNGLIQTGA